MLSSGVPDRTRTTTPELDVRAPAGVTLGEAVPGQIDGLPERIGRYRVLRKIGEGGMGAVYQAEQDNPRRAVALKLLLAGIAAPRALRRFEFEAQVLGRLQHPGIAQIHEAGMVETPAGTRPYFAMEYVEGRALLEHALIGKLGTRQRVELLIRICDAVEHAHQKGVIHRDLKPANILVDSSGRPKVLDFGVARLTDLDVETTMLQTEAGQLVGTLAYMSPEQLAADAREIDTRSDVYALGVLGYELVANRMPYDLVGKSIVEVAQVIRCEDPVRLSRVNRALRGDLEVIFGRALAKEKQQRYQSAAEFAGDLRRYLDERPILARPPSTMYQARKFVRRNKGIAAGLLVGAAALLGGAGLAVRFGWIAAAERDAARLARDEAQRAEAQTRKRADELKLVADFQAGMLAQVDPTAAGRLLTEDVTAAFEAALARAGVPHDERTGRIEEFREQWSRVNATDAARDLIDRTILKPAIATIDARFADQPVVDAQLRQTLATRYRDLGMYEAALPLQTRALATRRRVLGDEHPDTLASINSMGVLLHDQGRLAEAETYYREALDKSRRLLGEEHPGTISSINNLGTLLKAQGRLEEAEPYYREALAKLRRVLGNEHPSTLSSISNLGSLLKAQGKLAEAEPLYREALEGQRRELGDEHPLTLGSIHNLGIVLRDQGRLSEAEPYVREASEKRRRVLGEAHPDTLNSLNNLGALLYTQGRLAEAEPCFREVLEGRRLSQGEEHAGTLTAINNLGVLLQDMGKLDEAERRHREALEKRRRTLGEEHPDTLNSLNNLGMLLQARGRLEEAELCLRESLDKSRRVLGDDHPDTLLSINNLGALLQASGRRGEAETYFVSALERERRVLGDEHPLTLGSMHNLGALLRDEGRLDEAEPLLGAALEGRRRVLGEGHPDTLNSLVGVGRLRVAQGRHAEAVSLLKGIEAPARAVSEHTGTVLASLLTCLGSARAALGELDAAEADLLEANAIHERTRGGHDADAGLCMRALVELYTARDAAEPGKGYEEKAAEWRGRLAPPGAATRPVGGE